MKGLLTRLLTVNDDPRSGMDRKWRWWPSAGTWNGRAYLALDFQMTQWKGEAQEPHTVGDYRIAFVYDPRKWEIKAWHGYYDGPHCYWQFGPFEIGRDSLGWCLKCAPDSE